MSNIPLIRLDRLIFEEKQTLGTLRIIDHSNNIKVIWSCLCLERPWLNNVPNISCVPTGTYPIVWEYSPAFNEYLWELKDVPDRFETKFHVLNYYTQSRGCIGLGYRLMDINNDGYRDVLYSRRAINKFHKIMEEYKESQIFLKIV